MSHNIPMKLLDWIYEKKQFFYSWLSENSNTIHFLEQNLDNIYWSQDNIYWSHLSANPNVIHLLEQNIDKIDWYHLSENSSKLAINLLKENMDKIRWYYLNFNTYAI